MCRHRPTTRRSARPHTSTDARAGPARGTRKPQNICRTSVVGLSATGRVLPDARRPSSGQVPIAGLDLDHAAESHPSAIVGSPSCSRRQRDRHASRFQAGHRRGGCRRSGRRSARRWRRGGATRPRSSEKNASRGARSATNCASSSSAISSTANVTSPPAASPACARHGVRAQLGQHAPRAVAGRARARARGRSRPSSAPPADPHAGTRGGDGARTRGAGSGPSAPAPASSSVNARVSSPPDHDRQAAHPCVRRARTRSPGRAPSPARRLRCRTARTPATPIPRVDPLAVVADDEAHGARSQRMAVTTIRVPKLVWVSALSIRIRMIWATRTGSQTGLDAARG